MSCNLTRGRHGSTGLLAFTLIELLVVVGIIMLLMGLLFPAYIGVKQTAKKAKAKADVKQLEMAWKSVLSDYRTWANAASAASPAVPLLAADGTPQAMTPAAVSYLAGGNPKGAVYMEFDATTTNNASGMGDPWSDSTSTHVYGVSLGQSVVNPPHGQLYRNVALWSKGPDGKDDTAATRADDIKNWE